MNRIPKEDYEKILPFLPDGMTPFIRIQVVDDLVTVYSSENLERAKDRIGRANFFPKREFICRPWLWSGYETPLFMRIEKVVIKGDHCYSLLENGSDNTFLVKHEISLPRNFKVLFWRGK